ncbi:DNA-directed RNA polymerase subunit A [Sesbania bispinosa]|nr:DNA-directed RNA polymerase subunit A [Sesbania bispinosa]
MEVRGEHAAAATMVAQTRRGGSDGPYLAQGRRLDRGGCTRWRERPQRPGRGAAARGATEESDKRYLNGAHGAA